MNYSIHHSKKNSILISLSAILSILASASAFAGNLQSLVEIHNDRGASINRLGVDLGASSQIQGLYYETQHIGDEMDGQLERLPVDLGQLQTARGVVLESGQGHD